MKRYRVTFDDTKVGELVKVVVEAPNVWGAIFYAGVEAGATRQDAALTDQLELATVESDAGWTVLDLA